ncbi:MAG: DUF1361 domain-containing protein [Bacteroidales bacterium]|nr:DUF1361 domain-containing protein [Bacteroidales bacterium]
MTIKQVFKPYIKTLALFTLFCLCFMFIRNKVEQNNEYNFLIWNLFLGFVPFMVAWPTFLFQAKLNKVMVFVLAILWLLFYPNAPYMITDFIHVHDQSKFVIYDALMIFSFAMLSLFFGFYSLKLVQKMLLVYYNTIIVKLIVALAILLSSFGIYLGRILRLNSWDVFTHFGETMSTIFEHLFPITKNPVTYLMIFLFSIIQYILLNLIQNIDHE